jgi:hypothetical protein
VNSEAKVAAAVFSGLLLAGLGLRPLAATSGAPAPGPGGSGPVAEFGAMRGRGLSAAVLGGSRALVADGLWLKTYLAWSTGDLPAT